MGTGIMKGGKRIYIEVGLILALGMIWFSSIPIIPSSAQLDPTGCWLNISDCITESANRTAEPEFNSSSPLFNLSKALCCPLIQQTARVDRQCFCSIRSVINGNDTNERTFLMLLRTCDLPDSPASLDSLCPATVASPPPSDPQSIPSNTLDASKPPRAPPAGSVPPSATEKKKVIIVVAIVVPLAILLVVTAIGVCLFSRKAKRKLTSVANSQENATQDVEPRDDFDIGECLQYDFKVLQAATNNFSDDRKVGRGGFGAVYKGTLPNGQEIAVKRLSNSSFQGDEEFKNEVELVAKLQHRNLVRLMGFCLASDEKLLVYELVPNKSLDYFLFDDEKRQQLNWLTRYNLIRGIARGILYLHEDSTVRIVHRDLKAANILLDEEMNPKISDFGMARIFRFEQTHGDTNRVVGTYGYMAPEYLINGQFSVKSDVYSFGVLVMEIISGRRIKALINQSGKSENLLSYAWRRCRDGRPLEVMDPTLKDSYSKEDVIRCIHIGLLCVQDDMMMRPTMATIVLMLNSYSLASALPLPKCPTFLLGRHAEAHDRLTSGSNTNSMPWSPSEASINESSSR